MGFPIRKSPDQRLVSTSPRLIAAAHVLHRLLAPRHPPCALILLIRYDRTPLAAAMQFSRCARDATRSSARTAEHRDRRLPRGTASGLSKLNSMRPATLASGLISRVSTISSRRVSRAVRTSSSSEHDHGGHRRLQGRLPEISGHRIPRKEVIQPQLPLRLPCYDFTPITDPTFDGCLPCGLAHRLRVLPTFVV